MNFIPIEYRILFIFSIIVAFIITERGFSFDLKQRLIMFGSYTGAIFVGAVILYQILKILLNSIPSR
jgi:hypothetical protein